MSSEIHQKLVTGGIGFIGSVILSIPAYIEAIETVMKLISLALSISVALITLIKLSKDFKNGRRKETTPEV